MIKKMRKNDRNQDIDIIKGILVVSMIIYHCASMGRSTYPELRSITTSMNYIHFSFLVLSGFLCGWYYLPQCKISANTTRKRLRKRSGKILLIFLVTNTTLYLIGFFNLNDLMSSMNSFSSFTNNYILAMDGSLTGFEILYYISVFILLASFLLGRVSIFSLLVLILLFSFVSQYSGTIVFVCCGLIGFWGGTLTHNEKIKKYWGKSINLLWVASLCCLIYFFSFSIVRKIVVIAPIAKPLIYSIESFAFFVNFLMISKFFNVTIINQIILLGKHTLIAYLAQMLLIRFVSAVINPFIESWLLFYCTSLFLSTLLLFLFILLLEKICSRFSDVNYMYRTIFF